MRQTLLTLAATAVAATGLLLSASLPTSASAASAGSAAAVPAATPAAPAAAGVVTKACKAQTTGMHQLSVKIAGVRRQYSVYVPASWRPAKNVPVLYIFHGQGGEATGTIYGAKLDVQAEKDGFIVVAPQGLGNPSTWEVSDALVVTGSDAQFVMQLPSIMTSTWCTDPLRQYAAGYSSGSLLTHAMVCYGGFPYAGYAGAGAQVYSASCPNPDPFDFVYFHGTADPYVPFDGNDTIPSVEYSATTMAAHDGCEAQPTVTPIGSDIMQYTWSSCTGGTRLLYDILEGGGHVWPGADEVASLGKNTTTISADQVMSDFWHLSKRATATAAGAARP